MAKKGKSRKPLNSPSKKEQLILELRRKKNRGARRLQSELKRQYDISLSLATIHKVLYRNQVKPVQRIRRK